MTDNKTLSYSEMINLGKQNLESLLDTGTTASGKKMMSYEEMLNLSSEDAFQEILILKAEFDRKNLLQEMIEHEEKTNTIKDELLNDVKRGKQISAESIALRMVFDKNESAEIVSIFDKVKKRLKHLEKTDDTDLVQDAIYAKAASDFVNSSKHKN
ncbi:hypothetical protein KKC32_02830 [Patescibacteria group bacterium]|nr:hypothetical protein [Patescibacteria group bacterium]